MDLIYVRSAYIFPVASRDKHFPWALKSTNRRNFLAVAAFCAVLLLVSA